MMRDTDLDIDESTEINFDGDYLESKYVGRAPNDRGKPVSAFYHNRDRYGSVIHGFLLHDGKIAYASRRDDAKKQTEDGLVDPSWSIKHSGDDLEIIDTEALNEDGERLVEWVDAEEEHVASEIVDAMKLSGNITITDLSSSTIVVEDVDGARMKVSYELGGDEQ